MTKRTVEEFELTSLKFRTLLLCKNLIATFKIKNKFKNQSVFVLFALLMSLLVC